MKAYLPVRGTDAQGSGFYGAPRGSRTHHGIDYACYPETAICPFYAGVVTKLGKPYRDNPTTIDINEYERYDYVQITDEKGVDHRYFYVEPLVALGDVVTTETEIGLSQELHYKGITQHIHYEVKEDGVYLNPEDFIG